MRPVRYCSLSARQTPTVAAAAATGSSPPLPGFSKLLPVILRVYRPGASITPKQNHQHPLIPVTISLPNRDLTAIRCASSYTTLSHFLPTTCSFFRDTHSLPRPTSTRRSQLSFPSQPVRHRPPFPPVQPVPCLSCSTHDTPDDPHPLPHPLPNSTRCLRRPQTADPRIAVQTYPFCIAFAIRVDRISISSNLLSPYSTAALPDRRRIPPPLPTPRLRSAPSKEHWSIENGARNHQVRPPTLPLLVPSAARLWGVLLQSCTSLALPPPLQAPLPRCHCRRPLCTWGLSC